MNSRRGLALCLVSALVALGVAILVGWPPRRNAGSPDIVQLSRGPKADSPWPLIVFGGQMKQLNPVTAGGRSDGEFVVENTGNEPIQVDQLETSCECLKLEMSDRIVPPRGRTTVRYVLDLREQPQFVGALSLRAGGRMALPAKGSGSTVAFEVQIEAEVVK